MRGLGLEVRSWCSLLVRGAALGAFLRLGLLGGALGHPHERHPKRRPQRRQHERESPDRRGQQRYLHTTRAVITQPSWTTEVVVIFSTSNNTAGAMVAKPPRAVRRI